MGRSRQAAKGSLDTGIKAIFKSQQGRVFQANGTRAGLFTKRLITPELLYLGHGGVEGQPGHNPRAPMLVALIMGLSLITLGIGNCQIFDVGCDNGGAQQGSWLVQLMLEFEGGAELSPR